MTTTFALASDSDLNSAFRPVGDWLLERNALVVRNAAEPYKA